MDAMNSRIPRDFASTSSAKMHFREFAGGIALNTPVYTSISGQATRTTSDGGICLAVGQEYGDAFLAVNPDGTASILID